jgi:type I restriction enzyme S subunit
MTNSGVALNPSIGAYELPNGWQLATIGDLFEIQQGKALSAAARTAEQRYPFLRTSNVLWGRLDLGTIDSMGMSAAERSRLALLPGDLLVCEGGEIGRAAVWAGEIPNCYYQNHIHRLRPRYDNALPLFFSYWLQLAFTRLGVYEGAGTKTTIANLSQGRLSALEVPLPPLEDQRHIAGVLSTIQQAREANYRKSVALDRVFMSAMSNLLVGEL